MLPHWPSLRAPQSQVCSGSKSLPLMLPRAQPAGSLCSLLLGELRGGGQEQASQALLPHSWGPCLPSSLPQPGHNYFRLTNLLCYTPAHSPWCQRPGSQPGNPQHPQSPEGSGQLGQRKLGDLWAPTSWGAERVETGPLHRAELRSPTPQRLGSEKREAVKRKWFGDPAASRGHSNRSSYIRLTFSKPPGHIIIPILQMRKPSLQPKLFFGFV